jgi:hypothetical protein
MLPLWVLVHQRPIWNQWPFSIWFTTDIWNKINFASYIKIKFPKSHFWVIRSLKGQYGQNNLDFIYHKKPPIFFLMYLEVCLQSTTSLMSMSLAGSATRAHSVRFQVGVWIGVIQNWWCCRINRKCWFGLGIRLQGRLFRSGGGTIRSMAYDVEIMGGQNAWYSPRKTRSSHLARSHWKVGTWPGL